MHSNLKPATSRPPFRFEAGHPRESGAKGLTTTRRVSDSGTQPFLINEEVGDAGEERADDATITIMLRLHHDGVSAREIGRMLGGSARHDPGQSAPRACDRNCLAR